MGRTAAWMIVPLGLAAMTFPWAARGQDRPAPASASAPATKATTPAPAATAPATTAPATSAPTTATASARAVRLVQWHVEHKPAAADARKRNTLLVIVYSDRDAPAWDDFDARTLRDVPTRRFLADFAALHLDATTGEGKKRFAKTGAAEAPLTQVFAPTGELLDSLPGCIIPASKFRECLSHSVAYWKASRAKPFDAAARWRAARARLALSTRAEAVGGIDRLLKLPAKKRPKGATDGRLRLARGQALLLAKPAKARRSLEKALSLAPKDPAVGGEALLALGRLEAVGRKYRKAHAHLERYVKQFPKGPGIGEACYRKAVLEATALDDRAQAQKTLTAFIAAHPDDLQVVQAKRLLDSLKKMKAK